MVPNRAKRLRCDVNTPLILSGRNGMLIVIKVYGNIATGFEISVSQSRNAIYFSIIAMPKESHFTIFAIQNFVQNTKQHTRIPIILLESCLQGKFMEFR